MGYVVETTGRLLLRVDREVAAFESLKTVMADRQGWFDPADAQWPVTSFADLAAFAAASARRDGEWVVLATDEDGDPKWSEQATAFYAELALWVEEGTVRFSGEDGCVWVYKYGAGGMTQSGTNGWDGSTEPFGDPVETLPLDTVPKRRRWFQR